MLFQDWVRGDALVLVWHVTSKLNPRHHELKISSECNIAEQYVDVYIIM